MTRVVFSFYERRFLLEAQKKKNEEKNTFLFVDAKLKDRAEKKASRKRPRVKNNLP